MHAALRPGAPWLSPPRLRDVELDRHAREGASRPWVGRDLLVRGDEGLAGPDLEYRHVPADTDGEIGRAGATPRELCEYVLDDAVLKRVVGDDADPAARVRPPDRRPKAAIEDVELVVDLDAQGLEGLARGMPAGAPGRGGDAATSTSWRVVSMGALALSSTTFRAMRAAYFSSPYRRRIRVRSASL